MGELRQGGCCPPMDLFRSEPMQLVQVIIPIESAHLTVDYLGELGLIQFKDVRTFFIYIYISHYYIQFLLYLLDQLIARACDFQIEISADDVLLLIVFEVSNIFSRDICAYF